jgi:tetratricopeptide (TPR) repeat protein
MTRDNVLFTMVGALSGFIVGFFVAGGSRPAPAASPAAAPATASAAPAAAPVAPARLAEMRQAAQRSPDDMDAARELANAYYDSSDWANAAEWYEKVVGKKPADADLLTDLGSCYRNLSKFPKAVELYKKAQTASPGHPQSLLNLALVYTFDLKEPGPAQEALDHLKKAHPEIPKLEDLQLRISALRASKS